MTQHTKRVSHGVVVADVPDAEREYEVTKRIRWEAGPGGWLEPGDRLPADGRCGRNLAGMARRAEIREVTS